MSELKKISVLSNGKVLAHTNDGNVRLASEQETAKHFASVLPETYKNNPLEAVAFEDGFVYGKYANKTIRKKVIATLPTQTESIDSAQKAVDVPRNEKKSKPQDIKPEDKSVMNPTKIRTKDYKRGPGSERLDDVPRASGDGVGGKKVTFEAETADKATSGKPDTYVQEVQKQETPSKAGSEANHTASSEITFNSNGSMYQNLKLSKKEVEDKCPDCEKSPCTCDEKENKECCAETAEVSETKEAAIDNTKEVEALKNQIETLKAEVTEAKKALAKKEIIEKRVKASIKYALSMKELNPVKFASADTFVNLVENTANKMSVDLIENAIESAQNARQEIEASSNSLVKTSALLKTDEVKMEEGLATALFIPQSDGEGDDELKVMLMSETSLGRNFLSKFDGYEPHVKE